MKNFILGIGFAVVVLFLFGIGAGSTLGKYFFVENLSRLSFDETKTVIRENIAKTDGWVIRGEKDFNAAYQRAGQGDLAVRLYEYKIGNPSYSFRVNSAFPAVSVFMPAAIAVVEYADGRVVVYRKNTRLMGMFFSGVVKDIMTQKVPHDLDVILQGVI